MNTLEEIDNLKTQLALAQADLAAATERVEMLKLGIARLEGYGEALQVIRTHAAALRGLYGLVQDGVLVRDTSKDHESNWSVKAIGIVQKLAAAEAVIARQNPNAETVQSYPAGRWTEKGTV